jgi:hypothetical protein
VGQFNLSQTDDGRAQLKTLFLDSEAQRALRGEVAVRSANNELLAVAAAGPVAALALLSIPQGLAYLAIEGGALGTKVIGTTLIVSGVESATGALTFGATGGRATTGVVGHSVNFVSGSNVGDTVSTVIQLAEGVYAVGKLGQAAFVKYATKAEAEAAANVINTAARATLDSRPPLVVTTTTVTFRTTNSLREGLLSGGTYLKAPDVIIPYGFPIDAQGAAFEAAVAQTGIYGDFLGNGSKTFDFFKQSTGVATSTKTINTLTIAKLAKPREVENAAMEAIKEVLFYTPRPNYITDIQVGRIVAKQVVIAVPVGTNRLQIAALHRAVDFGRLNNVTVKIVITGR